MRPFFFQGVSDVDVSIFRAVGDDLRLGHRQGDRPMRGLWLLGVLLVLSPIAWAATYPDQGSAFAGCMAASAAATRVLGGTGGPKCDLLEPNVYRCWAYQLWNGGNVEVLCGSGGGQETGHSFPVASSCANRPTSTSGWSSGGNGASCSGGCAFGPATSSDTVSFSGRTYFSLVGAKPTGAVCSFGDGSGQPVATEDCVQSGALTQCVKADGRQCASASTGKQFCWAPGEAGVKKADNNNQAATKSPANTSINAPKDPPANGGDWTVTGQGTVSETKGGTTTNSTITTFDSSYGKTGTGKGDGTGTGGGSGDGDGDDDGEDDEAGGVGEAPGDFYKPTELTVSSLMGEYYTKVSNTPVLGAIKSFMVVNGGGSCPVFSMPATQWTPALSFDAHCSGTVYSVLQTMGWVLLAIVAFFAVRIAVT